MNSHKGLLLTVVFVLSCCYALLLVAALGAAKVIEVSSELSDQIEIVTYLDDAITPDQQEALLEQALKIKVIEEARVVDKQTAWNNFKEEITGLMPSSFFEDLTAPFPVSIEFSLHSDFLQNMTKDQLNSLKAELISLPGVSEIVLNSQWIEEFQKTRWIGYVISASFIFALLLGAFIIILLMTRQLIYSRKKEIELLELVGATRSFVRLPFIVEGLVIGLVSSIVSLLFIFLLTSVQNLVLQSELSFLGIDRIIELPSLLLMTITIVGGSILAGFASWYAVASFNKLVSAES